MTCTHFEENSVVPPGIHDIDGHHTHVAFDNFDRFVDTCGGKDTLHDTVGIIYQIDDVRSIATAEDFVESSSLQSVESVEQESVPKKRRKFDNIGDESRSYYSKPKCCRANGEKRGSVRVSIGSPTRGPPSSLLKIDGVFIIK